MEPKTTVCRRRLGAELRRLRDVNGLNCEDVAKHLECAGSKISRMETGQTGIRPVELRYLLDLYGVTEEREREALLTLSRHGRKRGWWHIYGDFISDRYMDYISLEAEAATIRTFEAMLVPGLLQTEAYARIVIQEDPSLDNASDIDTRVAVRMTRQGRLDGDKPLHLWAIVGEAALRQRIGGAEVMRDQLRHLLDMAKRPNVTLQVVPFAIGAHAGVDGSFALLDFPEPSDLVVVYVENLTSGLYIEDLDQIRRYTLVFDHLRAAALAPSQSVALIRKVAKELE